MFKINQQSFQETDVECADVHHVIIAVLLLLLAIPKNFFLGTYFFQIKKTSIAVFHVYHILL